MSRIIFCLVFIWLASCNSPYSEKGFPHVEALLSAYGQYKEAGITHRRFKHVHITNVIMGLQAPFQVQKIGKSTEGRDIMMVSYGEGPIDVLLWSQMHGDEPTATMALLDIFNFLGAEDDLNPIRVELRARLRLHFIPMLNPDGTERYQRRNAQGIDINRDALRLQTAEGRLLKHIRDSLEAQWGFNLHDQGRNTSAGRNPASISFLAPAFDQERSMSENRKAAMQVIVQMNDVLQSIIPGSVGRYWDDFEPRAFGDNIQKWGTRTILIESGGLANDREKQVLRKLNYLAIIAALHGIATGSYSEVPVAKYDDIPVNGRDYHDMMIRNLKIASDTLTYTTDIAYRFTEIENEQRDAFYLRAGISDLGDLSTAWAYKEFDAAGYDVAFGKIADTSVKDWAALLALDADALLRQGITDIKLETIEPSARFASWSPFKVIGMGQKQATGLPQPSDNPSFVLSKDGAAKYAIINGKVIDLQKPLADQMEELTSY